MERMQAGPGFQLVGYLSWCELGPTLMRCAVGFTGAEVGKLTWLWIQRMVYRWKRNREIIRERCMRRTRRSRYGWNTRWIWLCNYFLISKCRFRSNHAWGQNSRGPGCCSYFEDTSSADCASSLFSNSLPVFCLLFRHRISFQPFGFGLKSNPLLVVLTLTRRVLLSAPES